MDGHSTAAGQLFPPRAIAVYSRVPMSRITHATQATDWHPASWQTRQASQQPLYRDPARLGEALAELARLPPLVTSWEIEELKAKLARAQRGEAFLLQGGDCAESFDECRSEIIVQKLKILLQMSLVLMVGLKKPVVRVGRMAGQYAKPRSANEEVRDGRSLPSFRGDLVNRSAFIAADREPDPTLMLRGYERAALTLNFVRSLIDGGFADLHHPEKLGSGFRGRIAHGGGVPQARPGSIGLPGILRVGGRRGISRPSGGVLHLP